MAVPQRKLSVPQVCSSGNEAEDCWDFFGMCSLRLAIITMEELTPSRYLATLLLPRYIAERSRKVLKSHVWLEQVLNSRYTSWSPKRERWAWKYLFVALATRTPGGSVLQQVQYENGHCRRAKVQNPCNKTVGAWSLIIINIRKHKKFDPSRDDPYPEVEFEKVMSSDEFVLDWLEKIVSPSTMTLNLLWYLLMDFLWYFLPN